MHTERKKEKEKEKEKGEKGEIEAESRHLTSLELARVWPILLGSGSLDPIEGTRRHLTLLPCTDRGRREKTSWESRPRELIATYSTNESISTHFSPLQPIQTTVNPHDVIRLLLSKPALTFLSLL
jgi:hypothetical protein